MFKKSRAGTSLAHASLCARSASPTFTTGKAFVTVAEAGFSPKSNVDDGQRASGAAGAEKERSALMPKNNNFTMHVISHLDNKRSKQK